MPSKRDVLALLSRDELLAVVDKFDLSPPDRRAKDGLVETVAASKRATLAELLPDLSRDRLKELCRSLGLDDGGREKTLLIDRLTGARGASETPSPRSNGAARSSTPPVEIAPDDKLTTDKLEGYLWSAADILRGSIDSSDYKGFIFGLLFLKAIASRSPIRSGRVRPSCGWKREKMILDPTTTDARAPAPATRPVATTSRAATSGSASPRSVSG